MAKPATLTSATRWAQEMIGLSFAAPINTAPSTTAAKLSKYDLVRPFVFR